MITSRLKICRLCNMCVRSVCIQWGSQDSAFSGAPKTVHSVGLPRVCIQWGSQDSAFSGAPKTVHSVGLPRLCIQWGSQDCAFSGAPKTVYSVGLPRLCIQWSCPLHFTQVVQLLKSRCSPLLPPPPGCPCGVYKMMVQCWYVHTPAV